MTRKELIESAEYKLTRLELGLYNKLVTYMDIYMETDKEVCKYLGITKSQLIGLVKKGECDMDFETFERVILKLNKSLLLRDEHGRIISRDNSNLVVWNKINTELGKALKDLDRTIRLTVEAGERKIFFILPLNKECSGEVNEQVVKQLKGELISSGYEITQLDITNGVLYIKFSLDKKEKSGFVKWFEKIIK